MHPRDPLRTHPRVLLAGTLAVLAAAALPWACAPQDRGAGRAGAGGDAAVAVAAAQQGIDAVGGALRELRAARTATEVQERYPPVRMAADALAASLSAVAARFEAAVAAGQRALSADDRVAARPSAPAQRSPADGDLAMALDSLLMCRTAYAQVSGAHRAQLQQLTRALDRDRTVDGMQAVTPTIAGLLEDQSELRSILTDIAAKSKAVMTEIAMIPLPR